jgi:lipid-binding SYLF domain-containing protein
MNFRYSTVAAGVAAICLVAAAPSFASSKVQIDHGASRALKRFYEINPANQALVDKAAGVLIFSKVTKAGAGIGGEFGEGVLRVNAQSVAYYSLGSASVGLTLGAGEHREIILFMTPDSLDQFRHSEGWSVGADASFAMVTEGDGGQYDSVTIGKPVLGFIFGEKGLLGDASLQGSKITKIKTGG